MEADLIVKRYETNKADRRPLDHIFDLITRFMVPFRNSFFREGNRTESGTDWWQNRELYDSTAMESVQILSSQIHSSVTSQAHQWFEVKFKEKALNEDQESAEWIEKSSKLTFDWIQESNFDTEINETYIDLVAYNSAFICHEAIEDARGELEKFAFETYKIEECYFDEDHEGQCLRFYRGFEWTLAQIVSRFGEKNLPEEMVRLNEENSDINTKYEVVFCVYERPDKKKNLNSGKKLQVKQRPFGCKYILKNLEGTARKIDTLDDNVTLYEGGYYEFPVMVPRWKKTSGSKMGHGPGQYALPFVLTINELEKMTLRSKEKAIDPAILTTRRGLLSDLDLGPAGLTTVADVEKSVRPFESNARFDVGDMTSRDLRQSIRSIFFIDALLMQNQQAGDTFSEFEARYEMMQRLMGPTMSRLKPDLLEPIIQRTFNTLFRHGKFADPPDLVKQMGGELDIVYTGPLARSQQSDALLAVERWVGNLAAISEVFPDVLDIPDPDKIASLTRDMGGVPASMERSKDKIKEIRNKRQDQLDRMTEAEISSMSPEPEGDSMIPPRGPIQ